MNWFTRIRTFLKEVYSEMMKVTFPSQSEVVTTTIVVVIASTIYAAFLWAADEVILKVYQGINGIFGA